MLTRLSEGRGGHGGPPIQAMKRLALVTLIFLFGCSFNSRAAQEISSARGRELLKHGSYKEAISVFTAMLDKTPNDPGAVEGLIRAQIETGDYSSAEKSARNNLTTHATEAPVRVELERLNLKPAATQK